jgi:hypothetical protein
MARDDGDGGWSREVMSGGRREAVHGGCGQNFLFYTPGS